MPISHLLFLALLAYVEPAHSIFGGRKLGSNHWLQVHEDIRVLKRDGAQCSKGLFLCENGGCCPEGRDCGVTDCPVKTRAAATAGCSDKGYTVCAVEDGGGCCPSSFRCDRTGCIPPAGFTATSDSCHTGSRLCGAEFGYGCCGNDLDCGLSTCYPRTTSSFLLTLTVATTDAHSKPTTKTITVTTAYKPSRSTLPTSTAPAVPKESAHGTASKTGDIAKQTSFQSAVPPSGGGLSKGAIGGMVTGVVLCLVAVLVASFLIIRRLNTVARNSQRSQSTRGQYSDVGRPAMKQTKRPNHYHADSGGSTTVVSSGPGGYAPVPSSDTSGSLYHGSAQAQGQRQDYFGPPNPDQQGWNGYASPERIGTPPPTHGRSLSDTSTTTNGSFQGPPRRDTLDSNASELEAPDYRSPLERSFAVFGNRRPSLWGGRRSSSGQEAARARGLSQPSRLENVAEGDGSQIDVTQMRRVQH